MRVHFIRHADAESRGSLATDAARPLSAKGRGQAMKLAELTIPTGTAVYASPAVRCIGTVTPLASRLGVSVDVDARLAEGADPAAIVAWVTRSEGAELVLCSHGDVLPSVLRLLTMRGLTLDGPSACRKASVWTCTIDAGEPGHGTYRPPPA